VQAKVDSAAISDKAAQDKALAAESQSPTRAEPRTLIVDAQRMKVAARNRAARNVQRSTLEFARNVQR
jgi:hypothetical protein